MSEAAIALNRFGLGARPGEATPRDPRGWLRNQFGRYSAASPQIASLPGSAAILTALRDAYGERRELRQNAKEMTTTAQPPGANGQAMAPSEARNPAMGLLKPFRDDYL